MITPNASKILGEYLRTLRKGKGEKIDSIAQDIYSQYKARATATIATYISQMEMGSGYLGAAFEKIEPHATIFLLYISALGLHPSEKREIVRLAGVPNFNFEIDEKSLSNGAKQTRLPYVRKRL